MKRGAILLAVLLGIQSAQAAVLNVRQIYQNKSEWCWAATCQSVLEFYGLAQTQTNIAMYGTGGANVWNYLWDQGTGSDGIFRRGCDLILSHFGSVAGTGFTGDLTANQLQTEINAGRPVIINWQWNTGGGHIIAAHGMVSTNVYLMDPYYGPTIGDYNWVRSGGGHTWQWTLQLSTASLATNGVPRGWLGSYGLTNNWNTDALADQDADHLSTWEEYVADTNPTNAGSCFRAEAQLNDNGEAVVSWWSSSNRLYSLQACTNLVQPTWQDVSSFVQINGRGGLMVYTNVSDPEISGHRIWVMTAP